MKNCFKFVAVAALLGSLGVAHAAGTASLSATGYAETFDSMGTSGTTPPTGWTFYTGNSGTNHSTWETSIPGNGTNSVASMVATSSGLTAVTTPSGTKANGFNAAASTSTTSDRVLTTSPTSIAGSALQLTLLNNTGYSFNQLTVSYDTVRFTSVAAGKEEELPGYWLFYSLDGSNWSNVPALNPTQATVSNTSKGVSSVSNATFALSSSVAAGGSLYLRWVDDNGVPTSPDQIIGLNNVSIAAVPEPETYAMFLAGLGLLALRRRRA